MASILTRLVLPTPPSVYITVLCWATLAVLCYFGLSEAFGSHLGYSKFANTGSHQSRAKISTRLGMLLLYTPSFLAGLASLLLLLPHDRDYDHRFLFVSLALTIHYFKRDFEVLFIHKFSGGMAIASTFIITLSYFSSTANLIYIHHKLCATSEQGTTNDQLIDTKYFGIVLFLIGITGNFYHHVILSQLRKDGEKEKTYKIPKGGLFGLVICAHYLFEIVGFVGISLISQTLFGYFFILGTIVYLVGRSYATRKWYVSKFEDFPKEVKALIPFLF